MLRSGGAELPGSHEPRFSAATPTSADPAVAAGEGAPRSDLAESRDLPAHEAVREAGVQSFSRAPPCIVGPADGVAVHVVTGEGRTGVAGARVYVVPIGEGAAGVPILSSGRIRSPPA